MEDNAIITLFEARDEAAIRETDTRFGRLCRRLAVRLLQNEADAEECVNDAYLALWDRIPPERPDSLSAYLCQIVRRGAVSRYRRETAGKRGAGLTVLFDELGECLPGEDLESSLEGRRLTEALNRFLERQPARSRALFLRRYWYADSLGELAVTFHMNRNTVSTVLRRTREELRLSLQKEGFPV